MMFLLNMAWILPITIAVFALVVAMRKVKDLRRRVFLLAIWGALMADGLAFATRPGGFSNPDLESVLVFFLGNGAAVILGLLPTLFSPQKPIFTPNLHEDLNLKAGAEVTFTRWACPACGALTISPMHAYHVPQTCGECGKKIRLPGKSIDSIVQTMPMAILCVATYFAYQGKVSVNAVLFLSPGVFFPALFFLSRKKRLEEVQ